MSEAEAIALLEAEVTRLHAEADRLRVERLGDAIADYAEIDRLRHALTLCRDVLASAEWGGTAAPGEVWIDTDHCREARKAAEQAIAGNAPAVTLTAIEAVRQQGPLLGEPVVVSWLKSQGIL